MRIGGEPGARVAVRGEGEIVLHSRADHAQVFSAAQSLEQAKRVLSGQAEHGVRAERPQRLYDNVAADPGHALRPSASRLTRS